MPCTPHTRQPKRAKGRRSSSAVFSRRHRADAPVSPCFGSPCGDPACEVRFCEVLQLQWACMKDVTEMGNSNRYNTERPMVARAVKTCGLGKDRQHLRSFARISSHCSPMHDEYGLCPPLDMTAYVFHEYVRRSQLVSAALQSRLWRIQSNATRSRSRWPYFLARGATIAYLSALIPHIKYTKTAAGEWIPKGAQIKN